jgi:flagellar hook-length control protein FliK
MPEAAAPTLAPEAAAPSPGLAALLPFEPRRPVAEAHRTTDATTPLAEQGVVPPADAAAAPAATTQAEAPRAPPQAAPARQVTPAVVAVAISGGGRISVTLEPVELGRVEISVERNNDKQQVMILAERPETLALLQRDQRELDRALTQAGLPAEGRALSFGLSSGDAGAGQSQQRRDEARDGAPRGDGAARGVQGRDSNLQAAAPPRRVSLSLLDLAI